MKSVRPVYEIISQKKIFTNDRNIEIRAILLTSNSEESNTVNLRLKRPWVGLDFLLFFNNNRNVTEGRNKLPNALICRNSEQLGNKISAA